MNGRLSPNSLILVRKVTRDEVVFRCHCVPVFVLDGTPRSIGVRAGGARGAAAPPNFGQLRFFGQREKIWAKPVFKDVSMFI